MPLCRASGAPRAKRTPLQCVARCRERPRAPKSVPRLRRQRCTTIRARRAARSPRRGETRVTGAPSLLDARLVAPTRATPVPGVDDAAPRAARSARVGVDVVARSSRRYASTTRLRRQRRRRSAGRRRAPSRARPSARPSLAARPPRRLGRDVADVDGLVDHAARRSRWRDAAVGDAPPGHARRRRARSRPRAVHIRRGAGTQRREADQRRQRGGRPTAPPLREQRRHSRARSAHRLIAAHAQHRCYPLARDGRRAAAPRPRPGDELPHRRGRRCAPSTASRSTCRAGATVGARRRERLRQERHGALDPAPRRVAAGPHRVGRDRARGPRPPRALRARDARRPRQRRSR